MSSKKNYTLPIAMMFALFFMIAFVTGLQNPMGVIVQKQFQASNFLSQLGNLANFIAYAFMGIPAGLMIQKIGYKKTALTAIAIGFLGVAITFLSGIVSSFIVYLIGAFVGGFSMCMLNTVVNPMLNTLGGGGKKGNQLLQFGGVTNSTAATIVPVLGGYLMANNSKSSAISDFNPALFLMMGIFALAFIVLFFVNIPEPHTEQAEEESNIVSEKKSPLSFRHFTLGAIAIFVYVGVEVGIPNIANIYMTNKQNGLNMEETIAGSVVGTYWFLMLIGRLVGGTLGSKFSSKSMLTFVTGLGILFMVLAILLPKDQMVNMPVFQSDISVGMAQVPVGVMLLILCGLCTSVMWGGIFNLATAGLGKYTAAASGIFMVMVCGGGILPAIQGLAADSFGYIESYWVLVLGLGYMLFYALVGSKQAK